MISSVLTVALAAYFLFKLVSCKNNKGMNGFSFGVFLVASIIKLSPFVAAFTVKLLGH